LTRFISGAWPVVRWLLDDIRIAIVCGFHVCQLFLDCRRSSGWEEKPLGIRKSSGQTCCGRHQDRTWRAGPSVMDGWCARPQQADGKEYAVRKMVSAERRPLTSDLLKASLRIKQPPNCRPSSQDLRQDGAYAPESSPFTWCKASLETFRCPSVAQWIFDP
jgi:hypothetical protein